MTKPQMPDMPTGLHPSNPDVVLPTTVSSDVLTASGNDEGIKFG